VRMALAAVAFAAATVGSVQALSHPMPNTTVLVSAVPAGFDAEISIPLSELSAALGAPVREGRADEAALRTYVLDHAAVVGSDGRAWPARIIRLEFDNLQNPTLEVSASFQTPARADRRGASFRYDAVTHRVASHNVLIYLRDAPGADPRPLGRLQAPATTLSLTAP
jgi:hypothetical protein